MTVSSPASQMQCIPLSRDTAPIECLETSCSIELIDRRPIARLPSEILAMIFQWLPHRSHYNTVHVCHTWKTTTLSVHRTSSNQILNVWERAIHTDSTHSPLEIETHSLTLMDLSIIHCKRGLTDALDALAYDRLFHILSTPIPKAPLGLREHLRRQFHHRFEALPQEVQYSTAKKALIPFAKSGEFEQVQALLYRIYRRLSRTVALQEFLVDFYSLLKNKEYAAAMSCIDSYVEFDVFDASLDLEFQDRLLTHWMIDTQCIRQLVYLYCHSCSKYSSSKHDRIDKLLVHTMLELEKRDPLTSPEQHMTLLLKLYDENMERNMGICCIRNNFNHTNVRWWRLTTDYLLAHRSTLPIDEYSKFSRKAHLDIGIFPAATLKSLNISKDVDDFFRELATRCNQLFSSKAKSLDFVEIYTRIFIDLSSLRYEKKNQVDALSYESIMKHIAHFSSLCKDPSAQACIEYFQMKALCDKRIETLPPSATFAIASSFDKSSPKELVRSVLQHNTTVLRDMPPSKERHGCWAHHIEIHVMTENLPLLAEFLPSVLQQDPSIGEAVAELISDFFFEDSLDSEAVSLFQSCYSHLPVKIVLQILKKWIPNESEESDDDIVANEFLRSQVDVVALCIWCCNHAPFRHDVIEGKSLYWHLGTLIATELIGKVKFHNEEFRSEDNNPEIKRSILAMINRTKAAIGIVSPRLLNSVKQGYRDHMHNALPKLSRRDGTIDHHDIEIREAIVRL